MANMVQRKSDMCRVYSNVFDNKSNDESMTGQTNVCVFSISASSTKSSGRSQWKPNRHNFKGEPVWPIPESESDITNARRENYYKCCTLLVKWDFYMGSFQWGLTRWDQSRST